MKKRVFKIYGFLIATSMLIITIVVAKQPQEYVVGLVVSGSIFALTILEII